jgi:hypothetical protein
MGVFLKKLEGAHRVPTLGDTIAHSAQYLGLGLQKRLLVVNEKYASHAGAGLFHACTPVVRETILIITTGKKEALPCSNDDREDNTLRLYHSVLFERKRKLLFFRGLLQKAVH